MSTLDPGQDLNRETSAAFAEFLEVAQALSTSEKGADLDPLIRLERYKWVATLIAHACDREVLNDPRRPTFVPAANPYRRRNGDNPDAVFYDTVIDPSPTYRVTARPGDSDYTSVAVYGGSPVGAMTSTLSGNINGFDAPTAADGSYQVILSKEEHEGAWIKLEDDSWRVLVRDYFTDRERSTVTQWQIEVIDPPLGREVDTDQSLASRLQAATRHLRSVGALFPADMKETNTVGEPYRTMVGGGAADAVYAQGWFDLEPGQQLVIRGRSPACAFWNVCLWNRFLQTLDYRYERTSLNHTEVVTDEHGFWTIVISDEDPGVPNWVSTVGHRQGLIWFRWFLADDVPEAVETRLVNRGG